MYAITRKSIRLVQRGFTLVELLIVVIILAILAAIVIPQFSSSTTDAQEAALDSNLNAMRSAIELYKAQHKGAYPGDVITAATCTSGTVGTGAATATGRAQLFIDQLTMNTNVDGGTCSIAVKTDTPPTVLGPYLRKGIPNEPINNLGSLAANITVTATGAVIAPAAVTAGWAYDSKTGQFVMNSGGASGKDSKGAFYYTH